MTTHKEGGVTPIGTVIAAVEANGHRLNRRIIQLLEREIAYLRENLRGEPDRAELLKLEARVEKLEALCRARPEA